jgi:riboflavin synthase
VFTGIVEACVPVARFERVGSGARLVLSRPAPGWQVELGDSVAISGCCLTVAKFEPDGQLAFDLSAETLARTWFTDLRTGRRVNLERALRIGDRLGGHLVSGHVDGVGVVLASEDSRDGGRVLGIEVPRELARYLIAKGSVTLDGVSLTVVEPHGTRFSVALIPQTLARTTLSDAAPGARVHVEADSIGKWIERLLAERESK